VFIHLEKRLWQWAHCWAVIVASKCRTFVDIDIDAGSEPKSVSRKYRDCNCQTFWYRGHLTKFLVRWTPYKISGTVDSLQNFWYRGLLTKFLVPWTPYKISGTVDILKNFWYRKTP
jgi:hypothetical protein